MSNPYLAILREHFYLKTIKEVSDEIDNWVGGTCFCRDAKGRRTPLIYSDTWKTEICPNPKCSQHTAMRFGKDGKPILYQRPRECFKGDAALAQLDRASAF